MNRKEEEEKPEGVEPTEEVGPEECSPKATSCEFDGGELDGNFDGNVPKFSEEISEPYQTEPVLMVPHEMDGLPVPAGETSDLATAPPFTIDHVVCVEDERDFVELFFEEINLPVHRFGGWNVIELGNKTISSRSIYNSDGTPCIRRRFEPSRVTNLCGHNVVKLTELEKAEKGIDKAEKGRDNTVGSEGEYVFVRAIRERCIHYKRQVFSNDGQNNPDEFGNKIVFRNCMIRRSVGGAFMSLRDEAVYACDYRDPPDPMSVEKYLDEPDRKHLMSDAHLRKLPLFK